MANGLLTGAYGKEAKFDAKYDYRSVMPQFTAEAAEQNRALLALLRDLAEQKHATPAQISLSWMLHKYPNVVPIPGSKNQERILENLGAWNVALTDSEFAALEAALATIPVHGHRGFVEQQGSSMANWNRK